MDSINDEGPVHHLVTVEEVAIENEFESSILAILSICCGTNSVKFQLWGKGLEPVQFSNVSKQILPGDGAKFVVPSICLIFKVQSNLIDAGLGSR
jgi:hypothetical protein